MLATNISWRTASTEAIRGGSVRIITYRQFAAVGPEAVQERGSLLQFVLALPYLFAFRLIPPIRVLNEIFRKGEDLHGMSGGCQWEPFEIAPREYDELVEALRAGHEADYRLVEPPEWITSRVDWHIWTMEYEMEVPHEEFSELWHEEDKWTRLKTRASQAGDDELAMDYHIKSVEAGTKLAEFLEPYMVAYHGKKQHVNKEPR